MVVLLFLLIDLLTHPAANHVGTGRYLAFRPRFSGGQFLFVVDECMHQMHALIPLSLPMYI